MGRVTAWAYRLMANSIGLGKVANAAPARTR